MRFLLFLYTVWIRDLFRVDSAGLNAIHFMRTRNERMRWHDNDTGSIKWRVWKYIYDSICAFTEIHSRFGWKTALLNISYMIVYTLLLSFCATSCFRGVF
jgi:hypothetical protein